MEGNTWQLVLGNSKDFALEKLMLKYSGFATLLSLA